ncbi:MAG: HlyD family efflux transporter periplasmic adaptor subunit [Candidatus Hydrogenedentes bacterium]|nr:HlyD family efflux transporter periplasmic adaptor subunit [Candidatus Hydrogenedentota bacterium]
MSSTDSAKIRTPFFRLLALWRRRYLPILIWGGAVVLAVVLVQEQRVYVDAPGIMDFQTALVSPLMDGTVQSLAVDILDEVEAGQVVAMMDDTLIRSELMVAEAELNRVRALLEAESERYTQTQHLEQASVQNDLRRFVLNEEEARLDHLDRVIEHETDKVTLERLGIRMKRDEALRDQLLLDDAAYDEIRLRYEALKTKIDKDTRAIALAEKNIATAAKRRKSQESLETDATETDALLRALQADIAAQEARVGAVQVQRSSLALVAPVSGQVAAITRRPGESLLAGEPVLTITGAGGNRVLAYVDERTSRRFNVGDTVELHARTHPSAVVKGTIIKVGAHIESFPPRLLLSTAMPQYGYAVLVGDLPENVFRPGEALDLRLRAVAR